MSHEDARGRLVTQKRKACLVNNMSRVLLPNIDNLTIRNPFKNRRIEEYRWKFILQNNFVSSNLEINLTIFIKRYLIKRSSKVKFKQHS